MKLGLATVLVCGCAHTLSQQDKNNLAVYEAQQMACISATPHDRAAIDACRAEVKKQWCAHWGCP